MKIALIMMMIMKLVLFINAANKECNVRGPNGRECQTNQKCNDHTQICCQNKRTRSCLIDCREGSCHAGEENIGYLSKKLK